MTRYEMQHEIYTLINQIYPELQQDEVEKHLVNLWKCTDQYLAKYLKATQEIAGWKLVKKENYEH